MRRDSPASASGCSTRRSGRAWRCSTTAWRVTADGGEMAAYLIVALTSLVAYLFAVKRLGRRPSDLPGALARIADAVGTGLGFALVNLAAVGRWARGAVARWHAAHPGVGDLLLGETPFVGHRLVELARPEQDAAEPALAGAWARFVIPVPSRALREHLEAERARRARDPVHPREREDAPPSVLRDVWRELAGADIAYDPPLDRG